MSGIVAPQPIGWRARDVRACCTIGAWEFTMPEHGVRFRPGMVVSPGEYRNVETGATRYFDGSSPIPGGGNSAAWEQISDHHHPNNGRARPAVRSEPDRPSSAGVRFPAG